MNIAFFLTPKQDVVCVKPHFTMRQVLEKMEHHRYTAIPIVNDAGQYVGTVTEGDLLWKLKNTPELTFKDTNRISLHEIPKRMQNQPVSIEADIEDLIALSATQNFVPVIDDQEVFIGIIKRSDIINYCYQLLFNQSQ